MILVRHLREIDPITFTDIHLVSCYRMARGLVIALMAMAPDRRHPIDSYMGYVVFKNGLPVAYAGSWIFFDSARIGLNVFPAYRGGESQFIFYQVLKLHQMVYHLRRFSVDPYQIGKENDDGIRSGAFWIYYRAGFRPILEKQRQIAREEALKIKSDPRYRSPASTLKTLADSRMELVLGKKAFRFDATDLSLVYSKILKEQFNSDRKLAETVSYKKLTGLLRILNVHDAELQFVLKNWCVILLSREDVLRRSGILRKLIRRMLFLKANGVEEHYIAGLQTSPELRKFIERIIEDTLPGTGARSVKNSR
jgi:hypothetical protein